MVVQVSKAGHIAVSANKVLYPSRGVIGHHFSRESHDGKWEIPIFTNRREKLIRVKINDANTLLKMNFFRKFSSQPHFSKITKRSFNSFKFPGDSLDPPHIHGIHVFHCPVSFFFLFSFQFYC